MYPLKTDYNTAISHLDIFVYDSLLKPGKVLMDSKNPKFPFISTGGQAIVYKIQVNTKTYALKCWTSDLGDLKVRYKAIDNYLKQISLVYFVEFSYLEKGILVNNNKFPIVRMEWSESTSFKKFIADNINNPVHIRRLADKFLEMVKCLHEKKISHGDLQHGNILIKSNGELCLIDYDSLYVPELKNERDMIKGLDGYQHPCREKSLNLSPKNDYFSELVIYLSLVAISEKIDYWQEIQGEERLLFSREDFLNPNTSKIFQELKTMSPEVLHLTSELEKFCYHSDIELLQPLENVISLHKGVKTSWDDSDFLPPIIHLQPTCPVPPTQTTNGVFSPTSKDPWNKFSTNQTSKDHWGKFSTNPNPKDPWGKLSKSLPQPDARGEQKKWEGFDNFWGKVIKPIKSIWNKFLRWFN